MEPSSRSSDLLAQGQVIKVRVIWTSNDNIFKQDRNICSLLSQSLSLSLLNKNIICEFCNKFWKSPKVSTWSTQNLCNFQFCTNLQTVTFALRLDHVTVVAALTPKMQKSARRAGPWSCCSVLLTSTLTLLLQPGYSSSWKGDHSKLFWLYPSAGDVWQSLRRSPVALMLMYAECGQIQQHALARPFHTQHYQSAPNFYLSPWKAEWKWGSKIQVRDTRVEVVGLKDRFLAVALLCSGSEFNRRNEREMLPISDLLLQSVIF